MPIREYNAICDVCGQKFKNHQLRKRWDGYMVCSEDWEARHPMDYQKIPRTEQPVPWSRPEPTEVTVSVDYNLSAGTQENTIPSGSFNTSTL